MRGAQRQGGLRCIVGRGWRCLGTVSVELAVCLAQSNVWLLTSAGATTSLQK
jgi:hypothetical protein